MQPRPSRRDVLWAAAAASAATLLGGGGCGSPPLTDASPPTRLLPSTGTGAGTSTTAAPDRGGADRTPTLWPPPEWAAAAVPATPTGMSRSSPTAPDGLVVRFADARTIAGAARLRVTWATDVRAALRLRVSLAGSGRPLGEILVRDPYPLQPSELRLSAADGEAARREGVRLSAEAADGPGPAGSAVAVFVAAADSAAQAAPGYLPQLLVGSGADPAEQLRDRLASLDTLQPFGWMAGCVLDGQQDMSAATGDPRYAGAAGLHLAALLSVDGRSVRRPAGAAADSFQTVADTLPVAAIARRNPGHPLVDQAIQFWQARQDADGCVRDDAGTSMLGAYAVAYPLAVVAAARRVPALADQACRQLTLRLRRLVRDGQIYGFAAAGTPAATGSRPAAATVPALSGPGDSRAVAWWMLGLARTLRELPPAARPAELTAELARVAEWARRLQPAGGVWPAVLASPSGGSPGGAAGAAAGGRAGVAAEETTPETAGTAGIAAAMALGARAGLLPPAAAATARKALTGLRDYLTPDGYLAGVTPREGGWGGGGGAAAPAGYRAIAPYGAGLAGQVLAALQPSPERG